MPGPEDPLRAALDRLAAPADPAGAYERIVEKKIRRQIYRKLQVAALAVIVIAGTVGGSLVLASVFRSDRDRVHPAQALAANGLIAFVSNREGNADVFVMDHDGTHVTNLTRDAANDHSPAFSPDGTRIAFVSDRDGGPDIYVMNADGTDVHRLTTLPGSDDSPAWSPDGTRIAFADNTDTGGLTANDQLFVMNADGSHVVQLTTAVALTRDSRPAWSPDGTRLAISGFDRAPTICGQLPSCGGFLRVVIFIANADGSGRLRKLVGIQGMSSSPAWSPDGARIAFEAQGDLYVMSADGKDIRHVTRGPAIDAAPAWSPDGTKLVFSSDLHGDHGVDVVDLNGSGRKRLTSDVAAEAAPSWQPLPKGHPPVEPSESPTESPSPVPSPSPSEDCAAVESVSTADFEGDGLTDTATVGPAECLPPAPPPPEGTSEYSVDIAYGDGTEAVYPITGCQPVCQGLAAADLNGDGIDELFIVVDQGASATFLSVFELQNRETAGGLPTTVGLPGAPGFPTDQSAVFEFGGSVTHQGYVTCQTDHGMAEVTATTAALNQDQTEWQAHETIFTFDVVQGDGVPVPLLTVVSTDDSTQPFDPSGKQPFTPRGENCFQVSGSP